MDYISLFAYGLKAAKAMRIYKNTGKVLSLAKYIALPALGFIAEGITAKVIEEKLEELNVIFGRK